MKQSDGETGKAQAMREAWAKQLTPKQALVLEILRSGKLRRVEIAGQLHQTQSPTAAQQSATGMCLVTLRQRGLVTSDEYYWSLA